MACFNLVLLLIKRELNTLILGGLFTTPQIAR